MVKRNNYGINFDLGVPLESKWELSNLYVPVYDEIQTKLSNWIKDSNDVIYLGGQIGSGKSTAIQRAWLSARQKPDVELHFDREAFNLSAGDFWRIILGALIEKALAVKSDLSHLNIPKDLTGLSGIRWKQFLEILKPPRVDITLFRKRKKIQEKMVDNPDYIAKACEALISTIVAVSKKSLVFFASGIDKYDVDGAAFQDLLKPLQVLKKYKTLFELNVVHIYHPFFVSGQENHIFIPFFPENVLREILNRRMGAYSHNAERFINIAIQWSGGNPRQALRMLMELRQSKNDFQEGVILDAVHSLFFKYFGYTPKPDVDLLNVIRKQKEFDTTLLSLPGDKATARRAVYGNWIFLGEKCENGRVQAKLNPVVEFSVNLSISMTDPEIQLLNQYSEQRQMSGLGLDFNRDKIKGSTRLSVGL
jgi:hypothetical protein